MINRWNVSGCLIGIVIIAFLWCSSQEKIKVYNRNVTAFFLTILDATLLALIFSFYSFVSKNAIMQAILIIILWWLSNFIIETNKDAGLYESEKKTCLFMASIIPFIFVLIIERNNLDKTQFELYKEWIVLAVAMLLTTFVSISSFYTSGKPSNIQDLIIQTGVQFYYCDIDLKENRKNTVVYKKATVKTRRGILISTIFGVIFSSIWCQDIINGSHRGNSFAMGFALPVVIFVLFLSIKRKTS